MAAMGATFHDETGLRGSEPDIAKAREIADRKGIGYQTLLKMLMHEGLRREAKRPKASSQCFMVLRTPHGASILIGNNWQS